MTYSKEHLDESVVITKAINPETIESIVDLLADVKSNGGRLFILGVGGSAANAGHAVNDFRKLAGIETYAPTDNVAELTARANDEGWQTVFSGWLKVSKLNSKDCLFILSVGGGNKEKNVSPNLIEAIDLAKSVGARVTGIVGRDGGYTAKNADVCLVIPTVNPSTVTPHSESFQTVVWHLMVSHPKLKSNPTKW
jgi:D-sedoheptulose 7-phosphate isomerase